VLRPGAFARAEIVTASDTPALTVPVGSLVTFAGIEKVLVAENGAVKEKFITTGDRASNQIEVTSGLKAGELVLVNPGGLRAGRAVTATVKE
jgi:multidrug efflux pump subunit AcrA (membrane-fusion protein)